MPGNLCLRFSEALAWRKRIFRTPARAASSRTFAGRRASRAAFAADGVCAHQRAGLAGGATKTSESSRYVSQTVGPCPERMDWFRLGPQVAVLAGQLRATKVSHEYKSMLPCVGMPLASGGTVASALVIFCGGVGKSCIMEGAAPTSALAPV